MKHKMRRRKAMTREKSIKKWIKGRKKDNLPEPTLEMIDIFAIAYNMGFNMRNKESKRTNISPLLPLKSPLTEFVTTEEQEKFIKNILPKLNKSE